MPIGNPVSASQPQFPFDTAPRVQGMSPQVSALLEDYLRTGASGSAFDSAARLGSHANPLILSSSGPSVTASGLPSRVPGASLPLFGRSAPASSGLNVAEGLGVEGASVLPTRTPGASSSLFTRPAPVSSGARLAEGIVNPVSAASTASNPANVFTRMASQAAEGGYLDDAARIASGGNTAATTTEALSTAKTFTEGAEKLGLLAKLGAKPGLVGKIATRAQAVNPYAAAATIAVPYVANRFIPQVDGKWDDAARTAATWGSTAAGFGMLGSPLAAAIAGGAGTLAGGIWGYLHGKDSNKKELEKALSSSDTQFEKSLSALSLSPETAAQFRDQYNAMAQMAGSKDDLTSMRQQIIQQAIAALPADRANAQARAVQQARVAAMQAWLGPLMSQAAAQSDFYSQAAGNAMSSVADQIRNPGLAAAARAMATQIPLTNAANTQATLAQLAATPGLYGMGLTQDGDVSGMYANPVTLATAQPVDPTQQALNAVLAGN